MLEGLKGEVSIVELCRREGIVSNLYYRTSLRQERNIWREIRPMRRTSTEVGGFRLARWKPLLHLLKRIVLSGDNSVTTLNNGSLHEKFSQGYTREESVRLFRWNNGIIKWESLENAVDTAANEITGTINRSGIYDAFTTEIQTHVYDRAIVTFRSDF